MKITSVRVYIEADEDPDLSWLDQTDEEMGEGFEQSAHERKAAYRRGDWDMVGVVAEATIEWPDVWSEDGQICRAPGGSDSIVAGLWGIESDSERNYFRMVGMDQLDELWARLKLDPRTAHLTFSNSDVAWEF